MKRLAISFLAIFFALSALAKAQAPFLSETWHVKATNGHYGSNPKISREFSLSAPSIIKIEASVSPFCSCGKAGYQYFMYQHRAKGSSGDWKNGAPYLQEHKEVVYTPATFIDGKRLSWTFQWKVLPQAKDYNYRILLFPNAYWTGNGHYTPEQILDISIRLVSTNGGGTVSGKPGLGRIWRIREENANGQGCDGTWTRRGDTNVFDARWQCVGGPVSDVVEIEKVNGNQVVVYRRGVNNRYTLTLSPDGRQISGRIAWAPDWKFTGRIEY